MTDERDQRRLATILSIDIVGFSRASETDDIAAARHVRTLREMATRCAAAHNGRVFNTAGDGVMLEFPAVSEGVAATLELRDEARAAPGFPAIRLGLHVGDVTALASGDLIGAGVNVAARVQQKAEPGEALTTGDIRNLSAGQQTVRFVARGSGPLDKMDRQIDLFALTRAGAPDAKPVARRRKPVMAWAMAGVAAAAIAAAGLFALLRETGAPESVAQERQAAPRGQPVVVVLPFENLSGDPKLQYISDGLTEEIQYALSRARGMRVISRASSFALGGAEAQDAARAVNASHVLTGSVRRNGAQLRVSAQLALGSNGEIVWTQSFERPLAETLAVQDEIATRVARALRVIAPESTRSPGLDPRAYELYLRARDIWRSGGEGGRTPQTAIADLEEAVRIAPGFARAWTALASAYAQKQNWLLGEEQDALIRKAREAAEKALSLDPAVGEPYIVLGRFDPSNDWAVRGAWFDKALAMEPNDADVQMLYGNFWLSDIGQVSGTRRLLESAFEIDPMSPLVLQQYVAALVAENDLEAIEALMRAREPFDKEIKMFWLAANSLLLQRGDFARARAAMAQAEDYLDHDPNVPKAKADEYKAFMRDMLAALESDDPALIDRMARKTMERTAFGQAAATEVIAELVLLRRYDLAFEVAEELFLRDGYRTSTVSPNHGVPARYAMARPPTSILLGGFAREMQKDKRIWRIFAATGLARYWIESSQWPDFCDAHDLGYDCPTAAREALDARQVN